MKIQEPYKLYPRGKQWIIETKHSKWVFESKSTAEYAIENWR
mgnify:FL=1|jgi:hypothetical protein|tara:strand:- start:477 stop:602 length:126 start_codon:yes stop_codon:yes gene_type:complete